MSVDEINPHFVGGAIKNLAQLAACMLLGIQPKLPLMVLLCVHTTFILKSFKGVPRVTVFTEDRGHCWSPAFSQTTVFFFFGQAERTSCFVSLLTR